MELYVVAVNFFYAASPLKNKEIPQNIIYYSAKCPKFVSQNFQKKCFISRNEKFRQMTKLAVFTNEIYHKIPSRETLTKMFENKFNPKISTNVYENV